MQVHRCCGLLAPLLTTLLLVCIAVQPASAEDWISYGAQSHGMGGAGVAFVTGPHATVWNPANLVHYRSASSDDEKDEISTGRGQGFVLSFATAALELSSQGQMLVRADALFRTLDWLVNVGDYDDMADFFADPTGPMTQDLSDEITAGFATVANLASLNEPGTGLAVDATAGLDFTIGNFGFHIGATSWSSASPFLDLLGLAFSSSTGNDLADGLDTHFGPGGSFPFLPASLNLSEGGQLLSQAFADAGVTGSTPGNGYSRADLLAAFFELSAAQSGLTMDAPETRDGIVLLVTNTGGADAFTAGEDPFNNNDSAIELRGVVLIDLSVSFGLALVEETDVSVQVGVTGRGLYGRTFLQRLVFSSIESDIQEVIDFYAELANLPADKNFQEQIRFGFDIGLTVVLFEQRLRIAAVGKNINEPTFEFSDGFDFPVPAQFRAGVAFDIIPNVLKVSADIDINVNDRVTIDGFGSRELAFGLELKPLVYSGIGDKFGLAIRAGTFTNLELNDSDWLLTAGIGLRFLIFQLDVAGAISAESLQTRAVGTGSRPWADYGTSFGSVPRAGTVAATLTIGHTW